MGNTGAPFEEGLRLTKMRKLLRLLRMLERGRPPAPTHPHTVIPFPRHLRPNEHYALPRLPLDSPPAATTETPDES